MSDFFFGEPGLPAFFTGFRMGLSLFFAKAEGFLKDAGQFAVPKMGAVLGRLPAFDASATCHLSSIEAK